MAESRVIRREGIVGFSDPLICSEPVENCGGRLYMSLRTQNQNPIIRIVLGFVTRITRDMKADHMILPYDASARRAVMIHQ